MQFVRQTQKLEKIYQVLLELGASKKVLQQLFAKSSRTIIADRKNLSSLTSVRGRVPVISGDQAYELATRWEVLADEYPLTAERLVQLCQEHPTQNVNSIFAVVSEL